MKSLKLLQKKKENVFSEVRNSLVFIFYVFDSFYEKKNSKLLLFLNIYR